MNLLWEIVQKIYDFWYLEFQSYEAELLHPDPNPKVDPTTGLLSIF
jgi:hypothetical protein